MYTTRQVAELVGLSIGRVRAYARAGLVDVGRRPRGRHRYSFQDVVLLRMAKRLSDARVSARRIKRVMMQLRQRLPQGKPLSALRVVVEDRQVLVRERETVWHPESGQLALDFSFSDLGAEIAPLVCDAERQARVEDDLDSDEWYNLGVDLEMIEEPVRARAAYEKALALNDRNCDAQVNLGRLHHAAGRWSAAQRCYRQALAIDSAHATAWYNLGVLFEDRDRGNAAVEAYLAALAQDPNLADAHFNLARLYELGGESRRALRHLSQYKSLVQG